MTTELEIVLLRFLLVKVLAVGAKVTMKSPPGAEEGGHGWAIAPPPPAKFRRTIVSVPDRFSEAGIAPPIVAASQVFSSSPQPTDRLKKIRRRRRRNCRFKKMQNDVVLVLGFKKII